MSPKESVFAYRQYIEENDEIDVTQEDLDRIRNLRKQLVAMREGIREDILGTKAPREAMSDLVKHLKR
jgi:hypothetical protein